jgi:STE24 endopeptidase
MRLAATNAYLAQIPPDKTARSDAYFEGGYWMILWDFLYGVVVALLLLNLRWSARMRDLAESVTRFKPVHTFVYWLQYLLLTSILISRSPFTKIISASTSMDSPRKPLAPGWAIN